MVEALVVFEGGACGELLLLRELRVRGGGEKAWGLVIPFWSRFEGEGECRPARSEVLRRGVEREVDGGGVVELEQLRVE